MWLTLIDQARRADAAAGAAAADAQRHRQARDHAVRQLRAGDPQRWTYAAIAEVTGLGPDLVAAIIQGRTTRRKRR